jgi:cell wall-associated NlpC family hydrolase
VVVPVADLRSDQRLPRSAQSDDQQQTQLLYGETVEVIQSSGDWLYVHAIEQPEFTTHQKWEGYPGWVLKKAVRVGQSKTQGTKKPTAKDIRSNILKVAEGYLGTPYVWGGLSQADSSGALRGIDCSGLTHISYRLSGLTIPRDSMDQSLKAQPIKRKDLKPADLIFSAKADDPRKITHVALYAGDSSIVEAPQTGMTVRKIPFKEKFGQALSQVESGSVVGDRVVYFGRFIKD